MDVDGQCHALAALPPRMIQCPLQVRLGGPQARYGWVRKISPLPRYDPRTVQPVASSSAGHNWCHLQEAGGQAGLPIGRHNGTEHRAYVAVQYYDKRNLALQCDSCVLQETSKRQIAFNFLL